MPNSKASKSAHIFTFLSETSFSRGWSVDHGTYTDRWEPKSLDDRPRRLARCPEVRRTPPLPAPAESTNTIIFLDLKLFYSSFLLPPASQSQCSA